MEIIYAPYMITWLCTSIYGRCMIMYGACITAYGPYMIIYVPYTIMHRPNRVRHGPYMIIYGSCRIICSPYMFIYGPYMIAYEPYVNKWNMYDPTWTILGHMMYCRIFEKIWGGRAFLGANCPQTVLNIIGDHNGMTLAWGTNEPTRVDDVLASKARNKIQNRYPSIEFHVLTLLLT